MRADLPTGQRLSSVSTLGGIDVIESNLLPMSPSDGQVARRIVRHGMAKYLAWLGEDVGPAPDEQVNALLIGNTLHTSAAIFGVFPRDPVSL